MDAAPHDRPTFVLVAVGLFPADHGRRGGAAPRSGVIDLAAGLVQISARTYSGTGAGGRRGFPAALFDHRRGGGNPRNDQGFCSAADGPRKYRRDGGLAAATDARAAGKRWLRRIHWNETRSE